MVVYPLDMQAFLVRHWFLLVLVGGVSLALFSPGFFLSWTAWVDPRRGVGLALFLMAWGLPSRSLARELAWPWAALWAVTLSYTFLPAAAWLLVPLLVVPDYQIGVLIMASVPCTLGSAVLWTRRGRGNEATALLVILLSTGSSWLVTQGWLSLAAGTTVSTEESLGMMADLLLTLVVPVSLGQACRAVPILVYVAERWRIPLGVLAQGLILVMVFKAAANVGGKVQEGSAILELGPALVSALLCVSLHLSTLAAGFFSCRWFGCDRPRQIAVAFSCSQKSLPVALFLFESYFQKGFPLGVAPLLFYHVGQLVLDTFVAHYLSCAGPGPPGSPASAPQPDWELSNLT